MCLRDASDNKKDIQSGKPVCAIAKIAHMLTNVIDAGMLPKAEKTAVLIETKTIRQNFIKNLAD